MRWFRLDEAGLCASRKDSSSMITAALVMSVVWLVFAILYFLLARLGSAVWDAVARLRR